MKRRRTVEQDELRHINATITNVVERGGNVEIKIGIFLSPPVMLEEYCERTGSKMSLAKQKWKDGRLPRASKHGEKAMVDMAQIELESIVKFFGNVPVEAVHG